MMPTEWAGRSVPHRFRSTAALFSSPLHTRTPHKHTHPCAHFSSHRMASHAPSTQRDTTWPSPSSPSCLTSMILTSTLVIGPWTMVRHTPWAAVASGAWQARCETVISRHLPTHPLSSDAPHESPSPQPFQPTPLLSAWHLLATLRALARIAAHSFAAVFPQVAPTCAPRR